jgi:hypothetical protein
MIYVKTQAVRRRERYVLALEKSQCKQQRQVMACYGKKLSEHINTGAEGSSELFNVKSCELSSDSNFYLLRFAFFS